MKFIIKISSLIIIFFGFNSNIYCQNSTVAELNIPNHSPHSPEVSNLARYSEIPVNLYSGLPNINIPIYTIKTQELDLPIGLSYHGGGNKVNDVASWVGLGWTLNAGGQIYRVVKQLPDDAKNAGFIYTDQLVENTTELHTLKKIDSYHGNFAYGSQLMNAAMRGLIDFAPDEFYYNLPGYSGKFYFTQYRTTDEPYGIIIDDENKGIKIKPNFNEVSKQILGFTITTPDGILYSFGNSNDAQNCDYISNTTLISSNADNFRTINLSTSQNNREHITSWKMNSIRLKNGEHILFQYEKQHFSNICEYNGEDRALNTQDITTESSEQMTVVYGHGFSKSFTTISGFNSRLKKIIFKGGFIDFNESLNERTDVPYEKALDNISIYQSEFGVNKLYSKVVFDLGYFISSPPNFPLMGCLSFFDNDILTHRLRLNKVTFLNNEEEDPLVYRLEYSELNLPHKYSNSQDYWGYFNGKQNLDLIATMFVPEIPNVFAESFYESANREIDPDYTQANILKRIYYPEGGHTEFIFENNTRNPNLEIFGLENIFEPSILIDNLNVNTQAYNFIHENGKRYVRRNLRIPDSIGYRGRLEFFTGGNVCINDSTGEYGPSLPLEDCDIRFHIKRNIINPGPNVTHPFGVPLGYSGAIYIEPGDYVMEIEINSNETEISNLTENYAFAGVRYRENRFPDKKFIGGLRIKEILDFKNDQIYQQVENSHLIISNPDTIPTVKRSYVYKDNYNVDSGWIRGVPVFLTFDLLKISSFKLYYNLPPIFSYGQRRKISSGNTLSLMSSGSQYVGYTEVRELKQFYNEQEEYLVTASKFDYHPVFYSYLGAPVSFDWASGFEKEKTIYILKDLSEFSSIQLANLDIMYLETRSRPLKSIISERYPIISLNTSPVTLGTDKFGLFTNGFDIYEKYFEPFGELERPLSRYEIKTGVPLVKRQTEIDFFYDNDNQQSQKETVTNYNYLEASEGIITQPTSQIHHFLKEKKTYVDGNLLEEKYFYPADVTNNSLFNQTTLNQLILQNQVNTPLLKESWQNGQKLSTLVTHYKDWGNNAFGRKVLLPELIQTAKGDYNPLPLETRLRYVNINPLGAKTREVKQENGSSVVYLWGYNNSLPVAKIENLPYNSIPSNIRNAVESANTEGALVQALTNLREALATSEALVTTFTHIPLVGVKTITDPKGDTVTYHYDEFNRLKKVTDKHDNILSDHEYHYRTQN